MQESLEGWERKQAQGVQQWRSISSSGTLKTIGEEAPFIGKAHVTVGGKNDSVRWQVRLRRARRRMVRRTGRRAGLPAEKRFRIPVRRSVRRAGILAGISGVQPGAAGIPAELMMAENGVYENGDNFCVRTPILANLGFLKS